MLAAVRGKGSVYLLAPAPLRGLRRPRRPARPAHSAAVRPKGVQESRNLLPALDSTGEAPAKDKMRGKGVSDPKSPWTPVHPRPEILTPLILSPAAGWPTPSPPHTPFKRQFPLLQKGLADRLI